MTTIDHLDAATVRTVAESHGVCIRPLLRELTDTVTGETRVVAIPCGSTRGRVCGPCADKARRLRMQQCREGWHRDHEDEPTEVDGRDQEEEGSAVEAASRRVRSTRRRQDAPDLPRVPSESRTIGKQLTSPSGKTYRPSMFLTLTLPSYGKVLDDGTPTDPSTYDYRRAALDAMHFSKLVDRFWQNLRRCAGYRVQYFSAVEAQHRLAPHLHAAVRGVISRSVVLQVIAASYHQVWWPDFDQVVYPDLRVPVWDERMVGYVCPYSGALLPTWEEALDQLDVELEADPARRPAHVVRFGKQADYKWLIAHSPRTSKVVGYLTKYLTKSVAETYGEHLTSRQQAHLDRVNEQTRWLPCSPECANWLRYGIQPRDAEPGLEPGACGRAAHDAANLGYGGRRVLVSRQWTGKTLTEHRADRAEVVRQVLAEAGIGREDLDQFAADATDHQGVARYAWKSVNANELTLALWRAAVLTLIRQRTRWREQYERAKQAGSTTPRPPDNQPKPGLRPGGQGWPKAIAQRREAPLTTWPENPPSNVGRRRPPAIGKEQDS
ncbi:MAG: replication initiation protein [Nocardioides sp.]|nr:replication initiation protein [Nocardioides sp.]